MGTNANLDAMARDHWMRSADGKLSRCRTWAEYMAWCVESDAHDLKRIAQDLVGAGRVSTVFLSLDHAFGPGDPVLFETLIFDGPHNMWMARYQTEEQARRGHARVVENLRAGLDPDGCGPTMDA